MGAVEHFKTNDNRGVKPMNAMIKLKYVALYSVAMMVMAMAVGCATNQGMNTSVGNAQSPQISVHKQPDANEHGWDDETNLRISMTAD